MDSNTITRLHGLGHVYAISLRFNCHCHGSSTGESLLYHHILLSRYFVGHKARSMYEFCTAVVSEEIVFDLLRSAASEYETKIPARARHYQYPHPSLFLSSFSLSHTSVTSVQSFDHPPFPLDFCTMAPQKDQFQVPNVQFRVLIIGRANAGKTSILRRVCDTTESPKIYRLDPQGRRFQVRCRSWWRPSISSPS